ncbi:beta subunit of fatty acid synthetase [Coemansia erecta]|uniref:Beta subunit of fatty acid synthetase n=1 Tax=Coemansia erecta TaxID=147472 RepID=A0A9W7Y852_9FUNG|nr:beta subunit of fatty acid synthetase [Coemansia erecta]
MTDRDLSSAKPLLHALAQQQIEQLTRTPASNLGVGVDIELIADINITNDTFVERNFTAREQEYCRARPNVHASFAGKWCAKEAVIKAVSSLNPGWERVWVRGSAAPLVDIEICSGRSGAPEVVLHGEAKDAAEKAGVKSIKVSISHIDDFAIATAVSQ